MQACGFGPVSMIMLSEKSGCDVVRNLVILALCFLLSACGYTGALYLPTTPASSSPASIDD